MAWTQPLHIEGLASGRAGRRCVECWLRDRDASAALLFAAIVILAVLKPF